MMSNHETRISVVDATEGRPNVDRVFDLLRATSRTFALSIEGLPAPLREQIAVAYLLFRVSDYLEDHETLDPREKVRLLERWETVLSSPALRIVFRDEIAAVPHREDDPEAAVVREFELLLDALAIFPDEARRAITDRVRETSLGMARWQAKGPVVEDEADLDDYMHHVAGLVGYLVTDLFSLHFESVAGRRHLLMPLAREFGLALQCVNILRGLRKDYERGWIFVPRSFCATHDLLCTDLFRRSERCRSMRVVADLVEKAERHLKAGLAYVRLLPRRLHRVRLACMWPLLFAARTLAVTRDNPQVLTGEVKISRRTVKRIVGTTTLLGWSNAWLSGYTRHLLAAQDPQ